MKVLISDPIAKEGVELLKKSGYEVVEKPGLPPEELVKFIVDFDGIIVRSAIKVTKEIIEAGKLFCQLAVRKMGYCGGDVARFIGVTTTAVNKAANSEEVAAFQQYC